MRDVTSQNFGLLIAYLLPGFTVLWGLSHVSVTINSWFNVSPVSAPTLGGFLYVTIASVGFGLTISTIRWALIDPIHHRTGIHQPQWDFTNLSERMEAFNTLWVLTLCLVANR